MPVPWQPDSKGLVLAVRVTPKGGHDRIEGIGLDAAGRSYLKARVSAPPEEGKANAAVCALIAKIFKVAKSAVSVMRGDASREKRILIHGVTADLEKTAVALWLPKGNGHDS